MRTIAVCNIKGGVGKTSLAIHLATGLAKQHQVLLIDADPQGNATAWLQGLARSAEAKGTADVLRGGKLLQEHLTHVERRGEQLELLASTPALTGIDHVLAGEVAGESILRRALERSKRDWDYVVIDCPPNLELSVLNALCAADGVIAPVLGAYLSLAGLRRLEETVEQVRERLEVRARILGYVLFAADPREAITSEARDILRKEAKEKLYKAEVRVSTAAKSLPARRETAWDDGADERGEQDYKEVLLETLRRLGGPKARAVA